MEQLTLEPATSNVSTEAEVQRRPGAKLVDSKPKPEDPDRGDFRNLLQVLAYLKTAGHKISQSGLYKHAKERKLVRGRGGVYHRKAVDRYVRTWLDPVERPSAGRRGDDHMETAERERRTAQSAKEQAQARHWDLRTKILEGKYHAIEECERTRAMQATILRRDFEYFCRTHAPRLIEIAHGDQETVEGLIDFMLSAGETWFARFAEDREFAMPENLWQPSTTPSVQPSEQNSTTPVPHSSARASLLASADELDDLFPDDEDMDG
jgi:hypothetical protein